MRFLLWLSALAASLIPASAQSGAALAAVGYYAPQPRAIWIAPGQIVTLFVSGVNPNTDKPVVASTVPLPVTLAGLTIQFNIQSGAAAHPFPVPILAVAPRFSQCPVGGDPKCALTWVTVQMPYDIGANAPGEFTVASPAILSVSDGVNSSSPVLLSPVYDQIHILTDDAIRASLNAASGQTDTMSGPAITHADSSPVTASNPAVPGETLVMYCVGLGYAGPGAVGVLKAGEPSPSSPISRAGLAMRYDYTANAPPSSSHFVSDLSATDPTIRFAGLTPGLVGVWQVNFVVPAPPGPIVECGTPGGEIVSNLTVTLTGTDSFDGAGICVKSPPR